MESWIVTLKKSIVMYSQIDPNSAYGYGIIDANALANALTNPASVTISPSVA
jgi:hypothetical protein